MIQLQLGVKTDPVEYRYSFDWLFRLLEEEGVHHAQLGSFFEMYQLPDGFFHDLRRRAADHGVVISSLFTAHRELGGFFRDDGPGWGQVARRNFERAIEIGGLLGARSVGSNPGAVLRDRMGTKPAGTASYVKHLKELLHFAVDHGVAWVGIEPMSCLAEPPTLPNEQRALAEDLDAYHAANPRITARAGYCADVAHGYADVRQRVVFNNLQLLQAGLPWTHEIHLKNTDQLFNSTFGFTAADRKKGIVDIPAIRDFLQANAATLPVNNLVGYLEIGGPKLGRDYSDGALDVMLRESLRYLKEAFLAPAASELPVAAIVEISMAEAPPVVEVAPSMMCVDPLNFETALRRVEALGADLLHVDVMDGRFVPNLPLGFGVLDALAQKTHLPIDVHLMVEDNDFFLGLLEKIGARQISIHAESCRHLDRTLARIREMGTRAGVALNPATPLAQLDFVLERIDHVLLMTVNPGFAGQKLTPGSIRKISACRQYLDARGYDHLPIQVDGNVSFEHIPSMVAAGAQCLVAGTSSIFHAAASWPDNMRRIREAINAGLARQPQTIAA